MSSTTPSFFASPRHFVTGEYAPQKIFLPDDEYGRALDALVKACTDMLLTRQSDGKVLLGRRVVQPQPDWWYGCGGRMKPGETPFQSAARLLKRELAVTLGPEQADHIENGGRFQGVGHYSYVWQFREQEPKDHGTADISSVLTLELTDAEVAGLKLDSKEYAEHDWFEPQAVVDDEKYHPALRQSVADLIALRRWNELKAVVRSGGSDAEAGRLLKQFLASQSQPADGDVAKRAR